MLNSFQSAYIKSHFTETALLSIHDHIIKAMSLQQVLLERLSTWFGITSTSRSWIKPYLHNHSFYVNIEDIKSFVFQLLYGVPQDSVLGPIFFFSTLLLTVLSYLILMFNHHFYADDNQLFLSLSATDFSHNIIHLEQTIFNVCNWMSANFSLSLTL